MTDTEKILIIAGEPSGDRHAAELIRELKGLLPEARYFGIGGDDMADQGVNLLYHIEQMAFLGFTEVVRHLPFIRKVFKHLKSWMKKEQPAVVILVDYPGFNLRLAKMAHQMGVPVVYYICPQLWAWGEKRVEKIRRYVDLPLVIFKFEEDFYAEHGITAKFVGHPLVDEIHLKLSEKEFRDKHGLHPQKPIIALLPGSRQNEIRSLLPAMVQTAQMFPDSGHYQWAVGKANAVPEQVYQEFIAPVPEIKMVGKDIYHLMKYARIAIVASGTATLETGYLGTPMIVLYRVSPLTYFIGKRLVKVSNIALANIVSGKEVVPELIQNEVSAENISAILQKYFSGSAYENEVRQNLSRIREALGDSGATHRAALEIYNFLTKRSPGKQV